MRISEFGIEKNSDAEFFNPHSEFRIPHYEVISTRNSTVPKSTG